MAEKFWDHLKLKNGDTVKFVPPAPDGTRLGGVTAAEKAKITQLQSDNATLKQLLPQGTPTVGKKLEVLSVNADGTFTCCWADGGSSGSTDVQINGTSIVQDGVADITLTKLGAEKAKGEWVLKGTITSVDDLTVNLNGCTELMIYGTITGTGYSNLMINDYTSLVYRISSNGSSTLYYAWRDSYIGADAYVSSNILGTSSRSILCNTNAYSLLDKISEINKFNFNVPASVTSCNIKIYAR